MLLADPGDGESSLDHFDQVAFGDCLRLLHEDRDIGQPHGGSVVRHLELLGHSADGLLTFRTFEDCDGRLVDVEDLAHPTGASFPASTIAPHW
jgi:hypothetical protein